MIKIISDTPWYYYLLCIIAGLLFALLLYFKEKKTAELPASIQKFIFALRAIGITCICLLLTQLFIKRVSNKTEKPILLFAIDNSSSIAASKDSTLIKQNLLREISTLKNELSSDYLVNTILFGEKSRSDDSLNFADKETDFSDLFANISNNYSGVNVGALILVSDGIYNKGANPIYTTNKFNYPIYTVALGDTALKKDVLIQKINHNQVAYLGNQFAAEITIQAVKLLGEECKIVLYKNNIKKSEQTVKISSQNFISSINFILEADAPGIQKYQVKIEPLNNETSIANNFQSFVIDVIDNRDKILLLANAPHPDISAISDCIEGMKNYELVVDLDQAPNRTLKAYSLVIFHGYNANQQKILKECVANQIPYFLMNPNLKIDLEEIKLKNAIDRLNDAEPALNTSFNLFTISDALKNGLANFPAIKTPFGKYLTLNGAQFLLQQQIGTVNTGDPLLMFNDIKGVKSAVFVGDGLWRWKLRDFHENKNFNCFNELLSKSIQYLSVKSDKSFFRVYTQKIINENELVEFNAELYNRSYELITDPDVSVTLKNSDKKVYSYTFSKQNNSYKLNAGFLPPDEYSYEAKVKLDNSIQIKKGIIIVKPVISEKINTVADHHLLDQLSQLSGGKLFYLSQLNNLKEVIRKNETIKPITYSQNETTELIDLKILFGLIIALFGIEWYVRKYYGMV